MEANGFIFLSGQLPIDPNTGKIISDIKDATRQTLTNIQSLLGEIGLSLSDVVKITIFLTNIADFPAVNEIYAGFFPQEPPARSAAEVSSIPKGAPIEIDTIAIRR